MNAITTPEPINQTNITIPKPVIIEQTKEQYEQTKLIERYRSQFCAKFKEHKLKQTILASISNPSLDIDSRQGLMDVLNQSYDNLTEDYDENDDLLLIKNAHDIFMTNITKPTELIQGILYQGGKMSYNAPSKMGKTWSLMHLALSISEGVDWLGFKTTKSRILFINPELQDFSFEDRLQTLARNFNGQPTLDNFHYVSTRGKGLNINGLIPALERKIKVGQYKAIFLDSIYKLYPQDVEENSSSDVGRFLNELEQLANNTGAAIIYSHHYSKGNQSAKAAIDRSSGAGSWSRDPDAIISVTEHEQENTYSVEFNLRDFKPVPPITIEVNWPNVTRNNSLDPKALKKTNLNMTKKYSDKFLLDYLTSRPYTTSDLQRELKKDSGMSSTTFYEMWSNIKTKPGVTQNITNKTWSYIDPAITAPICPKTN